LGKKEYDWHIGETPPVIDLHSVTKHKVYEEYLMHYIEVLNSNPGIPRFNLTIVDGFSGGGEYLHPDSNEVLEGSPIRMIKAAEAAEALINIKREKSGVTKKITISVNHYFIEKKPCNFEYLENSLSERGFVASNGYKIQTINSTFVDEVDRIITEIKKQKPAGRTLFILDQYGYKDVPFSKIKYIFSQIPNAEVILTFATDWLINYMTSTPQYKKAFESTGLGEMIDIDELLENKFDKEEWRRIVQYELHKAILPLSGAEHYTPFFITSRESKRSFWLIHLSNHHRARDVMTQLHWKLKNHFMHYGGHGFKMFGYDPRNDSEIVGIEDMFNNTEYSFDEIALKQTIESVVGDMPRLINERPDGIRFGDFYKLVANETPATSDILKKASEILIDGNEVEVISESGSSRRSVNTIKDSDILRIPNQGRLITTSGTSLVEMFRKKKGNKK